MLSSGENMIAALERLKVNYQIPKTEDQPAIASLKISGKTGGFLKLFSTHPDLVDQIAKLRHGGQTRGSRGTIRKSY